MKDLPMFNKLFFVLCSSLLIALTSPSAAEEPTYHTIQGSGGDYEVFGTKQEAQSVQNRLSSNVYVKELKDRMRRNRSQRENLLQRASIKKWSEKRKYLARAWFDDEYAGMNKDIVDEEQEITAKMGEWREKRYIEGKIKAKLIEEAEAERLAKIAADKVTENARLARIAELEEIEDARLAKIAAAENVARAARIKEEIRKQQLEKKISSVLKIIAGINGPKDPNKITSITKDGQVRTLYCSSACTPGSVKLHEIITGIPMGVDVGTLTKRIEANAAQGKRQDNTNENNAKAAEDIASQGNVSIDTLFEQAEADIATHDTSFARAQSIPLGQRIRNREAHTDYVRSQSENEAYCLYEGC